MVKPESRQGYLEAQREYGHEFLLFAVTKAIAPNGERMHVLVASGRTEESLLDHARIHAGGKHSKHVLAYTIYRIEEVERGLSLGVQESRAGDN